MSALARPSSPRHWLRCGLSGRIRAIICATITLVALVLPAPLAAVGQRPASARGASLDSLPVEEDLVVFGRQVESLLEAGDFDGVAELFVPTDYRCPILDQYGQVAPVTICDGVPDGATVQGYPQLRFHSEGGIQTRESLVVQLGDAPGEFTGSPLRLYTVASTGLVYSVCESCGAIVFSTPEDDRIVSGGVVVAQVLYFEVAETAAGLRLRSVIKGQVFEGEGEFPIVQGGSFRGQTFIRVAPDPPTVGNAGLVAGAASGHSDGTAMWMFGSALILGALGIAAARAAPRR